MDIARQFNPWVGLAEAWSRPNIHQCKILLQRQGLESQGGLQMLLTMPLPIPHIYPFDLFWDESTTFTMSFDHPKPGSSNQPEDIQIMRRITHLLSRSTHSDNINDTRLDFIALFSPYGENELASWFAENSGRDLAVLKHKEKGNPWGFVRSPSQSNNAPHIFHSWGVPGADTEDTVEVECSPLPKRRHFLARQTLSIPLSIPQSDDAGSWKHLSIPIHTCTIDRLPFQYGQFSLFIPAILQHIEALMVTERLRTTILKDVSIKDARHISIAIIAPSAGWITNYQRYEFFGDTVLKFSVSYQLFCDEETWHEGYLSEEKNHIVSNQWLAKSALLKGLDQYIITEPLEARKKWPPRRISEIKSDSAAKRTLSTKVTADVVEALIGAAYIDSGMNSARQCIHAFLPDVRALPPPLPTYPSFDQTSNSVTILKAESVVGRQFSNKTLLIEALTHPCCDRNVQTESYQRLEFLGDAVLDMCIMSILEKHGSKLTPGQMTLIKAAFVNGKFLGFLCLDFSVEEESVVAREERGGNFTTQTATHERYLWSLLRHTNPDIAKAQHACVERHASLHAEIMHALSEGKAYPWLQLTKLHPDKFLSDMIESLIGAIFVDSEGSLAECHRFINRIGLAPYLNRVLDGSVDFTHPKSALGELPGVQGVVYGVRSEASLDGSEETYRCTVSVGGAEVASVTGCLCKDEAVVTGALDAMKKLKDGLGPS